MNILDGKGIKSDAIGIKSDKKTVCIKLKWNKNCTLIEKLIRVICKFLKIIRKQ